MTPTGRLVLVESPYKGRSASRAGSLHDLHLNKQYVRTLCRYVAMHRGDNPLASHMFCTQFLNDNIPSERARGIEIGFAWGHHAAYTLVGVDRGLSLGVIAAIERARNVRCPILWLSLSTFQDSWIPETIPREQWKELVSDVDEVVTHQGEI